MGQTFRYANTHEIGIYLLRLLDTVRPDADRPTRSTAIPTRPTRRKSTREELQERLGQTPLVFAENPDDLSSTFALLREGKSLWGLFLAVVLIGLVFETFVSNRLSPKQEEQPVEQPPPGMRRLAKKAGRRHDQGTLWPIAALGWGGCANNRITAGGGSAGGDSMELRELLQENREEMMHLAAQHGAANIRVFGSVARGSATDASDIDILR